MNSRANLIVLITVILISLALIGTGFYLFQGEHAKNIKLESELADLNNKLKISEAKLLEVEKVRATLEAKLKDSADQISTLNNQLQQEKTAKEESLAKIEQMNSDLDQQRELRLDLEQRLNKAQDDLKNIKAKLTTMESEKATLEAKVKEFEANADVELGKIVVNPEPPADSNAPQAAGTDKKIVEVASTTKVQEGKVLVLNKEYNFVVINLGSKDGVFMGDQFSIYEGSKYIGDVKVEKLQDSMSAAGFLSEDIKDKIKEGDKVIKKSK